MKKYFYFITIVAALGLQGNVKAAVKTDGPSLQFPEDAIALYQSDFDSGSYRIKQSGYYYFAEPVVFNPNPTLEAQRTDKPRTGWFTGLSVEVDNVVVDLNAQAFEASQEFVNNQNFKVFSLIELANSPFPHFTFAFVGETELKFPKNVVIKNGTLGRSSHHGIHGNNNADVRCYNLIIRDWEVAGIGLNELRSGEFVNLSISGVEHIVPFTGLRAVMTMAKFSLQDLIAQGDTNAQPYLDALEVMLADDAQNGAQGAGGSHDSNAYGMLLNRRLDVGPITSGTDTEKSSCISLDNVTVCGMKSTMIETIGMFDGNGTPLKGVTFGLMRWIDAYPNGAFAPNALLKAQVYAVNATNPSGLPAGFAANILSNNPSEATFVSQVSPAFHHDFAGHTVKGIFGIRVDGGHGVTMRNCNVVDVSNVGNVGATLQTLPGGSNFNFAVGQYLATNAYGISLAGCHNCRLENSVVDECSSLNGSVYGVGIFNNAQANTVADTTSNNHVGYSDNPADAVNPSSTVVGFWVANGAQSNQLIDCQTQSLTSPRATYGVLIDGSQDTIVQGGLSSGHQATSSSNLDQSKYAVGFASRSSKVTAFVGCTSNNNACMAEGTASAQSASRAVGYLFEGDDKYGAVTDCKTACNNGGAGTAAGILVDGASGAAIEGNHARANHNDNAYGQGFGIKDTAANSSSLFAKNVSYTNATRNYSVNFTEAGEALPVTTATYGNFNNLLMANDWNNVSLESAPGVEFQAGEVKTTIIQTISN